MNKIEIEPRPPYTYTIKTPTNYIIFINPTSENTNKDDIDPGSSAIIITTQEAIKVANEKKDTPVITTHKHTHEIENKDRVIELEEGEEHWIDNDTQIILLPNDNVYLRVATIEITYLLQPPKPSTKPIYTDIILLTPNTKKQHIVEANIHPQIILNPNNEPIEAIRHLATLHIKTKQKANE